MFKTISITICYTLFLIFIISCSHINFNQDKNSFKNTQKTTSKKNTKNFKNTNFNKIKPYAILANNIQDQNVNQLLEQKIEQKIENGSLWDDKSVYNSLYYIKPSRDIGDILYIKLNEPLAQSNANNMTRTPQEDEQNLKEDQMKRGSKEELTKTDNTNENKNLKRPSKLSSNKSKKSKKNILKATIPAKIIKTLPNNTFLIQGYKFLEINNQFREILVSGYIKETDINEKNEIDSKKIANLTIDYLTAIKQ